MTPQTLTRIGSDPRWLFGGLKMSGKSEEKRAAGQQYPRTSLLAESLEQHLGREEAELRLPQAAILSVTSRQVAIRQYLSEGIHAALSPDKLDRNSRRVILRKIQTLLHVHEGHANRVMNGLGIFAKDSGTEWLADHYIGRNSNFIRELDADLIQLLACGAGEHLSALMLKPYQFFANAACAALRLRLATSDSVDLVTAKMALKKEYPPFTHTPIRASQSAVQTLTPQARISLYGLAMWQSAGNYLRHESETPSGFIPLDNQTLAQVIRLAATEAPWVFPELFQIEIDPLAASVLAQDALVVRALSEQRDRLTAAQTDDKYLQVVQSSVDTVGLEVGKALCGMAPYWSELGEKIDVAP